MPSSQTIPVIEEAATVGREVVDTGALRVRLEDVTSTQPLDLRTTSTTVRSLRIPVDKVVEQVCEPEWRGEVFVVPVYEQRAVVTYETVLVEEIHISREHRVSSKQVQVPVSRQRVVIERRNENGEWFESEA